jgi:hypothetical protein
MNTGSSLKRALPRLDFSVWLEKTVLPQPSPNRCAGLHAAHECASSCESVCVSCLRALMKLGLRGLRFIDAVVLSFTRSGRMRFRSGSVVSMGEMQAQSDAKLGALQAAVAVARPHFPIVVCIADPTMDDVFRDLQHYVFKNKVWTLACPLLSFVRCLAATVALTCWFRSASLPQTLLVLT